MRNDETPIYELLMLSEPITIDEHGWPHYGRIENVGFYFEEETALQAIRQNWCDVNDGGVYKAALIQKKRPGIYPIPLSEWYFIFDYDNMVYEEKQLPKEMKHFCL